MQHIDPPAHFLSTLWINNNWITKGNETYRPPGSLRYTAGGSTWFTFFVLAGKRNLSLPGDGPRKRYPVGGYSSEPPLRRIIARRRTVVEGGGSAFSLLSFPLVEGNLMGVLAGADQSLSHLSWRNESDRMRLCLLFPVSTSFKGHVFSTSTDSPSTLACNENKNVNNQCQWRVGPSSLRHSSAAHCTCAPPEKH